MAILLTDFHPLQLVNQSADVDADLQLCINKLERLSILTEPYIWRYIVGK
jgi:hypothetical protein